jgi:hypothetical protein
MSHTDRLKRSPEAFRQLTGITPAAFDRLLAALAPRYQQADAPARTGPAGSAGPAPAASTPCRWPTAC